MATALDRDSPVGVLGAGVMGRGIARVAAGTGHPVVVLDSSAAAIDAARTAMDASLARDVEKSRLEANAAKQIADRVRFVAGAGGGAGDEMDEFRDCLLVIEAIREDLDSKQRAFQIIETVVHDDCILATNTSSLSVAAIGAACKRRERVVGLHFFNPPTALPLVEVVGAMTSDRSVVENARSLMDRWGMVPVLVADTPGFIVNRIARPFYGESLRILEEGIADIDTIDWAMREVGAFKMGPFELMDLIGNDVNFAVSRSIFESFFYDPRYRPSLTQKRMVEAGRLGRKSGVGYYDYRNGPTQPKPTMNRELATTIVDRVVAMLINEAAEAVLLRVASITDIDLAMTKGVNYPRGPLAWADDVGIEVVVARLTALQAEYGDDRYRPSALLKRMARDGGPGKGGRRFHRER